MSKAEERALEVYPPKLVTYSDLFGEETLDDNGLKRTVFIEGYHQAEKDLLENKHETSWRLDEKLWKGIKDIEEASYQYMYDASNDWAYDIPTWNDVQDAFKAGSEWKEEQFEKNRIKHCEDITEEQYNLETGFLDLYIKRFNRLPTFLDAIEYGKTLGVQKN